MNLHYIEKHHTRLEIMNQEFTQWTEIF